MSIVKMKKLSVIAVREQRDALMRELMRLGCVQVQEPADMLSDPDAAALLKGETSQLATLRTEQASIDNAVRLLDRYVPVKTPLLSSRPEVQEQSVLDEAALEADVLLAERIAGLDERIRACVAQESQQKAVIESLRPWEALDLPLESKGSKTVAAFLGSVPAAVELSHAADAAEAVTPEVQLIHVSSDELQHAFLVLCMRPEREAVLEGLRTVGFNPVEFPGLKGTAKQNISALQQELRRVAKRREALTAELAANGDARGELRLGADRIAVAVQRAEAVERLCGTDSVVAMEGWFPAEREEALGAFLARYDCAWDCRDPQPEEYPAVPVKLKNNRITRPLNMVTTMYSLPAYDGVDPNPLMAPFFILFYGIMMADMGYGLLMILGGLLVLKKMRPKGGTRDFFELLLECGVSTFVLGALTGGFFGDAPYQFVHMLNADSTWQGLPALFTPLNDTIYVLVGAMVLGVIQILTGMVINICMCARDGHLLDGILDQGCWMLTFAGIAVGAVTGFWWVAIAGVVSIVVTQGRNKKGVLGKIFGGFPALYDVTSYLGDVLSYSRIMALMLAGSVIAQVFNTLAAMIGNGWETPFKLVVGIVCFILIFLFGNALNFALNLLGCYVHDLRLQCLEFFGKFYKDGGKPFRPLHVDTKYVDIIKEEN